MRNIIGILGVVFLFAGAILLLITCGILDAPHAPIGPAIPYAIAAIAVTGVSGILINLYERGRA